MADLAHDASGPHLSEPVGIAVPRAGPLASSDKGKLRVFISYSRDDLNLPTNSKRPSMLAALSVSSTVTTFRVARTGNGASAT
jgi:hypothetical protein